jgi:hypothetical protein
MRRFLVLAFAVSVASCGGGPTKPSSTGSTGGSSGLQGQTVSAIDGTPIPNLSIDTGGSFRSITSDASGLFQLDSGTYHVVVRGNAVVERDTRVTSSSSGDRVRLSLIPAGFDMTAFDEMARTSNARLQRWTSRPALVILGTVMQYRSGGGEMYDTTAEQMTDDEIGQLQAHLNEGLALLTGNTYTSFASVTVERPAAGTQVDVLRTGSIVVGRYAGIESFGHTIGYGQWSNQADGTVVGGAVFLDRDFDRGDSRRRLLRIHELGHALGYQHVTATVSIMRPSIGPEPTDFDRAAALITFQRPPGNRSPDLDPSSASVAAVTGGGRWSEPTICR